MVLDPFCGGGSTLEAAESMGRRSLGFDVEPHWVNYTKTRMQTVTPSLFQDGSSAARGCE